jgi:DNA-binding Lrp family transcriptional regulator
MSSAQAYVLIQTDVGRSAQVAEEVSGISGVIAAHNVTGNYDVIVLAEAGSMDDLGRLVVNEIQIIHGITRTTTCSVVHL